jgi:hypothetical protein
VGTFTFPWARSSAVPIITALAELTGMGCGRVVDGESTMPDGLSAGSDASGGDVVARDGGTDSGTSSRISCRSSKDCPQKAFSSLCIHCLDGSLECASSQCDGGFCEGVAASESCQEGPYDDPCRETACGAACEQCNNIDGGCYPGFCNIFGDCKRTEGSCPSQIPTFPETCTAFDALGIGDCSRLFGWAWNGSKCVAIVGCVCRGSDCPGLFLDPGLCLSFDELCSPDAASRFTDGSAGDAKRK